MKDIPIKTAHLFPLLDQKLIELLQSLNADDWQKPTIAIQWTVKDVAAHLLDGNIRTLSISKDGYFGESPGNISSQQDLIDYLNRLNADWVKAMKRVSPSVLTGLLEITGKLFCGHIATLDPFAKAVFSVAWAGEDESQNWFHIAREYTEKWHHQQQIRDAVNQPGIMTKELYYPVLDTFMMALPFTYRNADAADGTVVKITVSGEGGGNWWLVKKGKWVLDKTIHDKVAAHTTIDGAVAWKLFSKSRRKKDVMQYVSVSGEEKLGEVVLDMISVMA
jgi:uncharacterized protein (TIGR03083 family)